MCTHNQRERECIKGNTEIMVNKIKKNNLGQPSDINVFPCPRFLWLVVFRIQTWIYLVFALILMDYKMDLTF